MKFFWIIFMWLFSMMTIFIADGATTAFESCVILALSGIYQEAGDIHESIRKNT